MKRLQEFKSSCQANETNPCPLNLKADYLAERSVPDNIQVEATQNTSVAIISYCIMLLYVGIALGTFPSPVYNRFSLGVLGIMVVIFALVSSIGLTIYGDVPLTMISLEVVPFLILAIGVDNIFLIARAEAVVPDHITEPQFRIAFALREIGPSIFIAALCESLAFFLGMQCDIPSLRSFCLVAGIGVLTDLIF